LRVGFQPSPFESPDQRVQFLLHLSPKPKGCALPPHAYHVQAANIVINKAEKLLAVNLPSEDSLEAPLFPQMYTLQRRSVEQVEPEIELRLPRN
jgi:hypothetical protein